MLDSVFQTFRDRAGNFVEQFQTTGFDARFFELYLYAYFSRSGFDVDQSHAAPDFLVTRDAVTVSVEATTTNPSTTGVLATHGKRIAVLTPAELRAYLRDELPMRFGSALRSKLQKRYWDLPHCRDVPLVIALQAFHDKHAYQLTDSALIRYLFGLDQEASFSDAGRLDIFSQPIRTHTVGPKDIPSNFFGQEDAEHVSAVLFTNTGTHGTFQRQGYQHGIGCDEIRVTRHGLAYNPADDALDGTYFRYDLDDPPFVEPWGQGITVIHNPHAVHPLPRDFFSEALQGHVENGVFAVTNLHWHPLISTTVSLHLGEDKRTFQGHPLLTVGPLAIGAISKDEFDRVAGHSRLLIPSITEEHGWFADQTGAFLGVIVRDVADDDWGWAIMARDQHYAFHTIEFTTPSLTTRYQAVRELQQAIAARLQHGQRIFPQDD